MNYFKIAPILLLIVLFTFCTQQKTFHEHLLRGQTMGTSFSIKVVTENPIDSATLNELEDDINGTLRDLNLELSTYIPNSELSQFNASPAEKWFPVSKDLFYIVQAAQELSHKSDGAFDITVGPLVNLWGFGPEHQKSDVPADAAIAARQKMVGYEKLLLQPNPPALKKTRKDLYCDLSAIAKGFGVDIVADVLEESGFKDYLVEIGGEIRARGHNVKQEKWRIGVSSPDGSQHIQKIINVLDVGIATSGDYRNYFQVDGVRFSHTIDPRVGRPISHNLASVTVIHESCMLADAYATAINVLGPTEGWAFAQRENLAAYLIMKNEHGFAEKMTPGFEKYLHK